MLYQLGPDGALHPHSEHELPQQSYLTAVNLATNNCELQLTLNSVGNNPVMTVRKHLQLAATASTVVEGLKQFVEGEGREDYVLSSTMHAPTVTAQASSVGRSQAFILLTFIMRLYYPHAHLHFAHLGSQNVEGAFRAGRATEQDMDVMGVLRGCERLMASTLPGLFNFVSSSGRLSGQLPVRTSPGEHVTLHASELVRAIALGVVVATDILRRLGLASLADQFLESTTALNLAGLLATPERPCAAPAADPSQACSTVCSRQHFRARCHAGFWHDASYTSSFGGSFFPRRR
jgi:hypothetical protein